jgi:hypothetical protein
LWSDSKLTFELHVRRVASRASGLVGLLRKVRTVVGDVEVVRLCFFAFVLPILEYCSPVWGSAAISHLILLDEVVGSVARMCGLVGLFDLGHRRKVADLCVFFKFTTVGHTGCALVCLQHG